MKLKDIQIVYTAICALDRQDTIVQDSKGNKSVVSTAYLFSGKTAWNLAKNRSVLKQHVELIQETKNKIIKQITGGKEEIELANQDYVQKFLAEINPVLEQEQEVHGLLKIKVEDLRLSENAISPSILEALMPIISE